MNPSKGAIVPLARRRPVALQPHDSGHRFLVRSCFRLLEEVVSSSGMPLPKEITPRRGERWAAGDRRNKAAGEGGHARVNDGRIKAASG